MKLVKQMLPVQGNMFFFSIWSKSTTENTNLFCRRNCDSDLRRNCPSPRNIFDSLDHNIYPRFHVFRRYHRQQEKVHSSTHLQINIELITFWRQWTGVITIGNAEKDVACTFNHCALSSWIVEVVKWRSRPLFAGNVN